MKLKQLSKSKTMLVAGVLVAGGVVEANLGMLQGVMTAESYGIAVAVIGGVMGILRAVTHTSLKDK